MLKKISISGVTAFVLAALSAGAIVAFPEIYVQGVLSGLNVCASVVVPSLFPFLVVSSFASSSSSCIGAMRFFSPVMRYVFRLPACAAPAVVFGFLGGYPVGCSSAARLYSQGRINAEQAQRITCFCVNAGPAFVITAVGSVMLGNIKVGAVLFCSVLLSSVILGIVLGLTAEKPEKESAYDVPGINNLQAFVDAVETGSVNILKICAWTVMFSCFSSTVAHWSTSAGFLTAFNCVFEVTSGCKSAAENGNLCTLAATLGWGGFCVGCQVMGDVRRVGAKVPVFFAFRAVNAGVSAVLCNLLLKVIPIEVSVFSNTVAVSARQFSYSLPATVALICLCAVFVIDLDRNRKVC